MNICKDKANKILYLSNKILKHRKKDIISAKKLSKHEWEKIKKYNPAQQVITKKTTPNISVKKSKRKVTRNSMIEKLIKGNGFFVDVGAADGKKNSNTDGLIDIGWKGIMIEPHPIFFNKLKQRFFNNKKIILINKAVWVFKTEKKFYMCHQKGKKDLLGQAASLLPDWQNRRPLKNIEFVPPITVECETLTNILDIYKAPYCIDYIDIDVEGADFEVLDSMDFDKYYVKYISIECSMGMDKLESKMNNIGYKFIGKYINPYFEKI